jgi:flagellin
MLTALNLATMIESVNGGSLSDLVTKLMGVGGLFNGATSPVMFNATFINNLSTVDHSVITGAPIATNGQANAEIAITAIDATLSELNKASAMHGALQNRLSAVISNLNAFSQNQVAARGRIVDADFAAEAAFLAKNQIFREASMAMLVQANHLQEGVLVLLQ